MEENDRELKVFLPCHMTAKDSLQNWQLLPQISSPNIFSLPALEISQHKLPS